MMNNFIDLLQSVVWYKRLLSYNDITKPTDISNLDRYLLLVLDNFNKLK